MFFPFNEQRMVWITLFVQETICIFPKVLSYICDEEFQTNSISQCSSLIFLVLLHNALVPSLSAFMSLFVLVLMHDSFPKTCYRTKEMYKRRVTIMHLSYLHYVICILPEQHLENILISFLIKYASLKSNSMCILKDS